MFAAGQLHDFDKITDIDGFFDDFTTGFECQGWYERHLQLSRHHLQDKRGVRDDVNLIDVLEMVADDVTAGMARSGDVYPVEVSDGVLQRALANTVEMLKGQVVVR